MLERNTPYDTKIKVRRTKKYLNYAARTFNLATEQLLAVFPKTNPAFKLKEDSEQAFMTDAN
jgi:hypothetical protein